MTNVMYKSIPVTNVKKANQEEPVNLFTYMDFVIFKITGNLTLRTGLPMLTDPSASQ
jgi:hypothetical protein